ncbi:MAG UNVERIFIED_CONTAM: hypothetical protein LVR18_24585 [Planctomycetaceae bacterium]|jgi:tetratricopeptide (TPR) repeat protein
MSKAMRLTLWNSLLLVFIAVRSWFRQESRYNDTLSNGQAAVAAGNVQSAFLAYGDAIRKRPDSPEPYFHRAAAMLQLGSFSKAQIDLNDLIRMRPNFGEAYRLRAVCYRAVGIEQKAAEDDAIADKLGAPKVIDDISRVVIPE